MSISLIPIHHYDDICFILYGSDGTRLCRSRNESHYNFCTTNDWFGFVEWA